mmetsp:Transcript_16810/g.25109  ORF Transcript_16810/g.25109 Transcript_16810/m.25109 type:complete len:327 (+) Transcript_16810:20-1000(+)|eukprot:CAMPEP_0201554558 /NCGR_PEP_ID=MMETSP0173_2-20130828/42186_1 /ASSEMBLY_ACC=CAM_ASM_000268 /TAXON_ID=218659 /ORGANISM="Vexillifera sp., Strain DIVA3 564/2" /LENGTH=326 /DNA_ID=CAMNT_0047965891 /DNA_START=1 /DNA_END=981 /DNA_ORIENTATION=+
MASSNANTNHSTGSNSSNATNDLQCLENTVITNAVQELTKTIQGSEATTFGELLMQLDRKISALKAENNTLAMKSICQLFLGVVTQREEQKWEDQRRELISTSRQFLKKTQSSGAKISLLASNFIRDNVKLLIHGYSSLLLGVLITAANQRKRFTVYITEAKPSSDGYRFAKHLIDSKIPVTVISDCAVGHFINRIDFVLVGAEAIAENGGIINRIGSFQVSMIAKAYNKPVYVASESYKFAKDLFPLSQLDLPQVCKIQAKQDKPEQQQLLAHPDATKYLSINTTLFDYTPPSYITLMFTDLGVLTPSAVSDELIKLEQRLVADS